MYRKQARQFGFEEFYIPFSGYIRQENRWAVMSRLIPWDDLEDVYRKNFSPGKGAPAKPFRMALGAVVIKELLGVSDREVVELIAENPYMQYFIGLDAYQDEPPFDRSMMGRFRRRLGEEVIAAALHALGKGR